VRRGLPRLERHGAGAVAVVAIVLAGAGGCGGSNGEGGTTTATHPEDINRTVTTETVPASPPSGGGFSNDQLIRSATTTVLASGDPVAACETYATANYVTNAFGDADGCKAAVASGGHARGVTMTRIVVDGDRATALAVPIGGPSANEVLDVTLVKDGDTWEVDSATSNVPVGP
jgi:hypothetical protein